MANKKVIVIGAGFAGMSAATYLADKGYEVTVLEKNNSAGGRGRKFEEQGFVFDMGPSWYWMPGVFEDYFAAFGKKVSDYYELKRLDPSYRIVYPKNEVLDIPAKMNELEQTFESIEPGSALKLQKFLEEARYKYEVGMNDLVHKPGQSLTEFLDLRFLKGALRLDVFKSMTNHIKSYFKDPQLIMLLEFPVLFLGATPQQTPALYSLMNYADMSLGTWYPKGGMHKIAEAMYLLALEKGVKFEFNTEVQRIEMLSDNADKIYTNKGIFSCDTLVAGADYHHVDQQLLDKKQRNYSPEYWDKRVMAPSSLIFYLGINKKIPGLLHHTLFFDEDFKKHAHEIYTEPVWPEKPLFYVCCTSKSDSTVAPEGMENVFILVPVAPGLEDTEAVRENYYQKILEKLEKYTGTSIRDHVIYKRSYAHNDFIKDYHSFKGNAYGLANTLKQTAVLKPSIRSKKVKNLFYTGQLTVPGPGVPPSLISGKVVASEIVKQHQKN